MRLVCVVCWCRGRAVRGAVALAWCPRLRVGRNTARSFRGKLSDLRLQSAATMVSANQVCFYCGVQFRSKDVGAPKFCARISQGHGPPTSDEITTYGPQPTPDDQPAHPALSLDSPRAHEKCARWMHAINLVVASVRRGRSAGLDERPPAVQRQYQPSTATTKLAGLTSEAAGFGASATSSAEPIVESRRAQATLRPRAAPMPTGMEEGSSLETPQPSSSTTALPQDAAALPASSTQRPGQASKVGSGPARRRKGLIDPSRPLHSYSHRALLRVARTRSTQRSDFLAKLKRKIEQHSKVCHAFPHRPRPELSLSCVAADLIQLLTSFVILACAGTCQES